MEGNVYQFTIETNECKPLLQMMGTVTCIRWCHGRNPMYLAVSDNQGNLGIFKYIDDDNVEKVVFFPAREQMEHVKSNEIWSVAWSPCNKYLATGGEDHTTHIYSVEDITSPILLQVLEGKTAAVTCVDWQQTKLGNILAVSSDDRTMHCWKKEEGQNELSLYHIFHTDNKNLMITYCALEYEGYRLAAGTMSGQMYLWDLQKKENIFQFKGHIGSIEGLVWTNDKIFTCSSDCILSVNTFFL